MRRLTVRVLVAVGLALLLYARAAGPARADTYFVSTPTELQSAITSAAATDGDDTINLAAGTFDIGNTIGTVQLRAFGFAVPSGENAITLVGAGPALTVLDGDGSFGEVVAVTGSSTMTIRSLTIRNGGDGVDAVEQGVTLDDVVIRDNTGNAFTGGNLTISDSTVTNNVEGIDVECGIIATNTTIADNAGTGLGVDCTNWNSGLSNVTVAGNGVGIDFDDSIELDNSIVAGNTAQDCEVQPGRDPIGTNDLIGSGTCGSALTGVVSGDPLLGPLQDNGGLTPTMLPAAGSPAVDAGDDALCPATDQRGVTRPQGAHCDIGAVEVSATAPSNNPPACSAYSGSVTGGGVLHDSVSCSDPDAADSVTVAAVSGPTHGVLALTASGAFAYTPDPGFSGPDGFTYQAVDSHGALSNVASASLTVVAPPPPVCRDVSVAAAAGSSSVGGELDCTSSATLTATIDSGPTIGSLTLSASDPLGFTYAIPAGFAGTDSFAYHVTDVFGQTSNTSTVTIQVPNRPPVCGDHTSTVAPGGSLRDAVVCTDPDTGDTVSVSTVAGPAHGTLALQADGTFDYSPDAGFSGDDTFTFDATDSHGATSSVATATIHVTNPNHPPVCADVTVTVHAGGSADIPDPCSDPDGDAFSVIFTGGGTGHSAVSVTQTASGAFHVSVPSSPSAVGTNTVTYVASDVHNAVSGTGTLMVDVVNQAPVCSSFSGSVDSGAVLHASLACSDPDGDVVNVYTVLSETFHEPNDGTVSLDNAGTLTFTPTVSSPGLHTFTFDAMDVNGGVSNVATVDIVVQNTPVGSNVAVPVFAPPLQATLTFASVTTPGVTSATTSSSGTPPPNGFSAVGQYWDFTTTATYTAPIEVCVPSLGAANPHLFHYLNGTPVDVTTRTTATLVCGSVSSLSPFVVAVPTHGSSLTYTGATSVVFGPATVAARLTDSAAKTGLGGEPVSFSIDGGPALTATTAADGTASATTALPLSVGAHTVAVAFAGDASHRGSQTQATVKVANSARGTVTALALRLASGAALELVAHVSGGHLLGDVAYTGAPGGAKPYLATTITAFGISADGHTAWVAGRNDAGHTFLAQAVDNGVRGDRLRLWIDGVLVDGDGALSLGLVNVDPSR